MASPTIVAPLFASSPAANIGAKPGTAWNALAFRC
jgi:hypothetical protein